MMSQKEFVKLYVYIYNSKYKVPVRVVRPFNNYGPGMKLNDGRLPADTSKKYNF